MPGQIGNSNRGGPVGLTVSLYIRGEDLEFYRNALRHFNIPVNKENIGRLARAIAKDGQETEMKIRRAISNYDVELEKLRCEMAVSEAG